mmetsp:Transcript_55171/g.107911  ORF Transcript_55171/g.107911 Transcript_55171/m.107911 type:complete len:305 (+) Transcript_55171:1544-2458(+)
MGRARTRTALHILKGLEDLFIREVLRETSHQREESTDALESVALQNRGAGNVENSSKALIPDGFRDDLCLLGTPGLSKCPQSRVDQTHTQVREVQIAWIDVRVALTEDHVESLNRHRQPVLPHQRPQNIQTHQTVASALQSDQPSQVVEGRLDAWAQRNGVGRLADGLKGSHAGPSRGFVLQPVAKSGKALADGVVEGRQVTKRSSQVAERQQGCLLDLLIYLCSFQFHLQRGQHRDKKALVSRPSRLESHRKVRPQSPHKRPVQPDRHRAGLVVRVSCCVNHAGHHVWSQVRVQRGVAVGGHQ